jgi:hypothetical protein
MSDKTYDSLFHELWENSKNDKMGIAVGCTTREHYFGYLCWQAATQASEAKLLALQVQNEKMREANRWCPFETVPRDGTTEIILGHYFDDPSGYSDSKWLWQTQGSFEGDTFYSAFTDDVAFISKEENYNKPTHWKLANEMTPPNVDIATQATNDELEAYVMSRLSLAGKITYQKHYEYDRDTDTNAFYAGNVSIEWDKVKTDDTLYTLKAKGE